MLGPAYSDLPAPGFVNTLWRTIVAFRPTGTPWVFGRVHLGNTRERQAANGSPRISTACRILGFRAGILNGTVFVASCYLNRACALLRQSCAIMITSDKCSCLDSMSK